MSLRNGARGCKLATGGVRRHVGVAMGKGGTAEEKKGTGFTFMLNFFLHSSPGPCCN